MEKLRAAYVSTSKGRLQEKQSTLFPMLEKGIVLELNVSAHKDGDRGDQAALEGGARTSRNTQTWQWHRSEVKCAGAQAPAPAQPQIPICGAVSSSRGNSRMFVSLAVSTAGQ